MRGLKFITAVALFCIFPIALFVPPIAAADMDIGGAVRVTVARVTESVIADRRKTTGVIRAWRVVTVAAGMAGRVVDRAIEPGYSAGEGELLLRTDPRSAQATLREARATVSLCRVDVADAKQGLMRIESLLDSDAVSQDMVDDRRFRLARAEAQLEVASAALEEAERLAAEVEIRAPFAGMVEAVSVQVGDYVTPGVPVAVLSDFSRARVITGIGSAEISRVAVGHTAEISIAELGGLYLSATVTNVGRIKDQQAGTFPVELVIDGPGVVRLRDGIVATVVWDAGSEPAQTAIPTSAVLRRRGQLVTYVVEDGVVTERPVITGRSDGEQIVIHDGLLPGEYVVIDGHFALRDGATVEITNASDSGDAR